MLINLREKESNDLVIKDYLDVDFDMYIEESNNNEFMIRVNKKYRLDDTFDSRQDAEYEMLKIMKNRNRIEHEIMDF